MTIDPGAGVTALVLLSALLHASWNALMKRSGDSLLSIWGMTLAGGLSSALVTPFVSFPPREVWPLLVASQVLHVLYMITLAYGYRVGHLNQVYPIARGLAPCIVALFAFGFAGERLGPAQAFGLVVVAGSIASLALSAPIAEASAPRDARRHAVWAALLTGILIGGYSYVDAQGARGSAAALDFIIWSFVLDIFPITLVVLALRRGELVRFVRCEAGPSAAGGLLGALAYGVVIWAMAGTAMAWVAALRETSVIFGALIGAWVLREPFGLRRLLGGAGVALGLILFRILP